MNDYLRAKKSNCKNCYKCIRHCPVKSIRFSAGQANIVPEECILCGQCYVVCPQDAKQIADDTERVRVMLDGDAPVYVSLAPAFVARYPGVGGENMDAALRQLGFAAMEETALGATIVKREYDRLLAEENREILISSCCHSVNMLIQRYFPGCIKYLADVVSPMVAHATDLKTRHPQAKVVFVGPCISKKDEAEKSGGLVDAALTFDELDAMLAAKGITPQHKTQPDQRHPDGKTRLFPITGGILRSMDCTSQRHSYLTVDGVENCIAALQDIESGKVSRCFIEMSACTGSCVGGPVLEKAGKAPISATQQIMRRAGLLDFEIEQPAGERLRKAFGYLGLHRQLPSESELAEILRQMGKSRPEQELNCGS